MTEVTDASVFVDHDGVRIHALDNRRVEARAAAGPRGSGHG